MATRATYTDRAETLAHRIAQELDVPFRLASMEETLEPISATHVLFRRNTGGEITFASCGLLPSVWREKATSTLIARMEAWLEGVIAVGLREHASRTYAEGFK